MKKDRHLAIFCLVIFLAFLFWSGEAAAGRIVRVGVYQNEPKIFIDEDGRPAGLFIELLEKNRHRRRLDARIRPLRVGGLPGRPRSGRD
ncbi:MAG: hypothetical protein RMJ60_02965 [Anaerolineales bacterium]|nr:hypothetical protein [Anaerolineales bacterium]